MRKIESEFKDESWIKDRYLCDKMTIKEMSSIAGVSNRTMLNWMIEFGIERRTHSESIKGKYAGENSFFYGKCHSIESRAKISKNHADVSGQNNPMFGKTGMLAPNFGKSKSLETKQKLSKANKGRKRPEIIGCKNPNWKGGRTSLLEIIRSSINCSEWRQSIYQRDKYTCQDCGDFKGGNLNAHHLTPLALLLDIHNITTLHEALACHDLWDISNGITLCKKCHTKRHPKLIRRIV